MSAPSGQQLTTALKGERQMENKTGKREKEKKASLIGKMSCTLLLYPARMTLLFRELFSLLLLASQSMKQIKDFPQTLEDFWSQQVEKGVPTYLQLTLVICFESWMKGSTGSVSVSVDLERSPVQHRGNSSRCLSMRLLQSALSQTEPLTYCLFFRGVL